jgi:hypothetical protein
VPKVPSEPRHVQHLLREVRRRSDGVRTIGHWPIDEPFPVVLTDDQLMRVLGVRKSTFYAKKKLGRYRKLEVRPPMTTATRYSGALVRAWAAGQWTEARAFGRRTA